MKLPNIPEHELLTDLRESVADILVRQRALLEGVDTYSGGSVVRRLDANIGFVDVITSELHQRYVPTGANGDVRE